MKYYICTTGQFRSIAATGFAIYIVLYALLFSTGEAVAEMAPGRKVAAQVESTSKLIESSSAAQQVMNSNAPDAWFKYQKAKDFLCQGRAAIEKGDNEQGQLYLSEAVKYMFAAVRLAEANDVVLPKKMQDYKLRMQTLDALLDAHKRISTEKKLDTTHEQLLLSINPVIGQANKLADGDDIDKARSLLDQAYVSAKKAIESLREGDTLVRSLKFESRKQEYEYELDRNDTHKMLVTVLLKEKMEDRSVRDVVEPLIKNADELRAVAIALATHGDHAKAIIELEKSTIVLIRAIRNAGVYIPG